MSYQEAKKLYEEFVKTGELFELFSDMTGKWKEDKERFMSEYKTTIKGFDSSDMEEGYYDDDFNDFF